MVTVAVHIVTSLGANSHNCMFLHFWKVEWTKVANYGFPGVFIDTFWYEK